MHSSGFLSLALILFCVCVCVCVCVYLCETNAEPWLFETSPFMINHQIPAIPVARYDSGPDIRPLNNFSVGFLSCLTLIRLMHTYVKVSCNNLNDWPYCKL